MQNNFYAVKILRKPEQSVASVYMQEFFKFCGVCVWEQVIKGDEDPPERQRIGSNKEYQKQEADIYLFLYGCDCWPENEWYQEETKNFRWDFAEAKTYDEVKTVFSRDRIDFFAALVSNGALKEEEQEVFNFLSKEFESKDYARKNYEKHCFAAQMSPEEVLEQAQYFYDQYESLNQYDQNLKKGQQQSPYVIYAMLNCARKVNDCCVIRGEIPLFKKKVILKEADDIRKLDKNFIMGDVLGAILAISEYSYSDQVLKRLQKLWEAEKDKRASVFILYFIGHYYEMERKEADKGWKYYSNILSTDPHNYRAKFKDGCREIREKNYNEAYEKFDNIIQEMINKEFIQPLEIEYCYKCLLFCSKIESINGNFVEAEQLGNEAREWKEQKFKQSKFVENFFAKDDIEKFSDYLKKKMERYQI